MSLKKFLNFSVLRFLIYKTGNRTYLIVVRVNELILAKCLDQGLVYGRHDINVHQVHSKS